MPPAPPELPEGMAATTVLDMTALAVEAPSDEELLLEEVDVLPTGALQPVESFDPSPTPLPQRPAADVDFDWPSLDKDQAGVSDDLQAVPTSLFSQSAESGKSETPPLPQDDGSDESDHSAPISAVPPPAAELTAQLEEQIAHLDADNRHLQQEALQAVSGQAVLRVEVAALQRQSADANEHIAQLEQRAVQAENATREVRRQHDALIRERATQASANSAAGQLADELRGRVEAQQSQLHAAVAEIHELKEQLGGEQEAHNATRNALKASSEKAIELTAIKQQLEATQSELLNTRDSREVLALELDTAQRTLEDQLTDLRRQIEAREEEVNALQATATEKASRVDELQVLLRDSNKTLQKLEFDIAKKSEDLTSVESRLSENQRELADARANLNRATGEVQAFKKSADERGARVNKLASDSRRIPVLEEQRDLLQRRLDDAEVDKADLLRRLNAAERDQAAVRTLEEQRDLQQRRLDDAEAEKADLLRRLNAAERDQATIRTERNELRAKLKTARAAAAEREGLDASRSGLGSAGPASLPPESDTSRVSRVAEAALDAAIRSPRMQQLTSPTGDYEAVEQTQPFSPDHLNPMRLATLDDDDEATQQPSLPIPPLVDALSSDATLELEEPDLGTIQLGAPALSESSERVAAAGIAQEPVREEDLPDASAFILPATESDDHDMGMVPVKRRAGSNSALFDESMPPGVRLATILNQKPVFTAGSSMRDLNLDSRAAYLLSRMDGSITFGDLMDTSGLPPNDTAEVLLDLVLKGVI